ncbi:hypothetical protein KAFR_0E04040 [Kazachstania africana CBS 2517]|uniref:Uncharacterized protein n=1 Tax=Kazachstania africana (strain ATCC 22294 / BCRC 22015 / CBS 2517 / CECT 1963 / NBRC 1671 / NRRL Y-8276) TaxID=1071382 RepID=H2AW05_KAZAF|nr:hypothetical protein KAFR_0E04040 [Kazachstania africana CBS 2517]CCF58555.1 hypothetical protein KAFR_0E04040 [Kazachstania africana CBS 2517]
MSECTRSLWPLVSTANSAIAFVTSFISLFPQIIETYRDKTVEGLSPYFLLAWVCGDITSLTGAIITKQLAFQIVLACYFLLNDLIVLGQYYYYGIIHGNKLATAGHESKPMIISRRGSAGSNASRVLVACSLALANGVEAARVTDIIPPPPTNNRLGLTLSWIGGLFYVCARIPQLVKNWQRKSTDGVSPFLFATTLACNLTYNASIFTNCKFIECSDKFEFVYNEAPFIFGSLGTVLFDLVYFYQCYVLYVDDSKWRELERNLLHETGETSPLLANTS